MSLSYGPTWTCFWKLRLSSFRNKSKKVHWLLGYIFIETCLRKFIRWIDIVLQIIKNSCLIFILVVNHHSTLAVLSYHAKKLNLTTKTGISQQRNASNNKFELYKLSTNISKWSIILLILSKHSFKVVGTHVR